MVDFLLIAGSIIILLPVFYFISGLEFSIYTTAAYVAILAPTLATFINGAPFVPTPMNAVHKMLKIGNLKPGDKVYDIGCGDGRFVHFATKNYSVRAIGLELSPFVYLLARIRHLLWRSKATIKFGSFKRHDLSDADVIFCYLLPDALTKLVPKLERELKPGARIISYAFPIKPWQEEKKYQRDQTLNLAPVWVYEKK